MAVIRIPLIAVLALLVFAGVARADSPCTKNYVGPTTDNRIDTPANWAPAGVPGADDVVCWGAGVTVRQEQVITVAAVRTAGTFISNTDIVIDAETPAGAETSSIGTLQKAGHLTFPGTMTIGDFVWLSGLWQGGGTTTITGNWRILANFGAVFLFTGTTFITAPGSTITGAGFELQGSARWINHGAYTTTNAAVDDTAVGGVEPTVYNAPDGTITNNGSGVLNFATQVENDGVITNAGTGTMYVYGDPSPTVYSDGSFTKIQLLSYTGKYFRLGANAKLTDITNSADLRFADHADVALTNYGSAGGTLSGPGAKFTLLGHTTAYYGRLGNDNNGLPENQAALIWLPPGATMTWTAAMGFYASRFETDGDIRIEETGLGRPPYTLGAGMLWENTGTITALSGLLPQNGADEGQRLVNRGRIIKVTQTPSTPGTLSITQRFVNDGIVEIERGTLSAPKYEQTSDGVLRFHLRGTTASSDHGLLTSTALRFSGRIEAVLDNAYVPAAGARFNVITATAATRSGEFLSTGLPTGFTLDTANASNLALVAPPAALRAGESPSASLVAAAPAAAFAPMSAPALPAPASTPKAKPAEHPRSARRTAAAAKRRAAARRRVAVAKRRAASAAKRRAAARRAGVARYHRG